MMNNKEQWLKEAINYIDSLDSEEFEEFLTVCAKYSVVTDFSDLHHATLIVISEAANMDSFYSDDLVLAA